MNERDEAFYRKWSCITQTCSVRPLVMVVADEEVVISLHGKPLITYSSDGYQRLTAYEISEQLEKIGSNL